MEERWMVAAKKADFQAIGKKFHIDPVIARVIRNRGIIGDEAIAEYLYGGMECLADPFLLLDMEKAVEILKEKIRLGKKIRVIGDYDIDGIMSSYILKRGITELGGDADIRIPHRMTDGYGINESMIEEAKRDGVDTIVTCDNGISASVPVSLAGSYGMTVVVTDHHEVLELPPADAVIDPKRPGDPYPNKNLCGGSVAWKLIRAMGGDADGSLLGFAAFATIGDIMELTGENRILVKEGLKILRRSRNYGLRALSEVCGIRLEELSAWQIGFVLGPCLNASGRLDTAMRAVRLLEAASPAEALSYARELKDLNDSRKAMTESGVEEAVRIIEEEGLSRDRVLAVFLPDIHESICGIIAGRIREMYSRPVFVLTRGESLIKGSGRSTEYYSMFEELVRVKDLLIKFGGHPMAAGLSLREEDVGEFRRRLNENCTLTEEQLLPKILIDVPMPLSYVTEELTEQLSLLEPFGKGNEKPVFADRHVLVEDMKLLGAKQNLLKLRLRHLLVPDGKNSLTEAAAQGRAFEGITFRSIPEMMARIGRDPDLSIVYEPQFNEYMGVRSLQILISHFH